MLQGLMGQAAGGSTHTVGYYYTRVGQAVRKLEGPPVKMPSRATFYRLFGRTEVIHAPPRTRAHKPHIERTLGSAASLFAQFLTGYTGRSAEYRGRKVAGEPLWSLPQLQGCLLSRAPKSVRVLVACK